MADNDNNNNSLKESATCYHSWSLQDRSSGLGKQLPVINFHSIKFSHKSLYVWIGDAGAKIENMACSMKTPYEKEPLGVDIMLATTEEQNDKSDLSRDLAIKLAKRLDKQVIVSFNVSPGILDRYSLQAQPIDLPSSPSNESQLTLMQHIERCLIQEIKVNPDKF